MSLRVKTPALFCHDARQNGPIHLLNLRARFEKAKIGSKSNGVMDEPGKEKKKKDRRKIAHTQLAKIRKVPRVNFPEKRRTFYSPWDWDTRKPNGPPAIPLCRYQTYCVARVSCRNESIPHSKTMRGFFKLSDALPNSTFTEQQGNRETQASTSMFELQKGSGPPPPVTVNPKSSPENLLSCQRGVRYNSIVAVSRASRCCSRLGVRGFRPIKERESRIMFSNAHRREVCNSKFSRQLRHTLIGNAFKNPQLNSLFTP